jgi:ankyrin repeat protein
VAAFLFACAKGDMIQVKERVTAKTKDRVNLNTTDYDRRTGLHLAASEGHTDIVKYLVQKVMMRKFTNFENVCHIYRKFTSIYW